MEPLSSRLVEDAVVYPTIRVASRPGRLLMGVYGADGDYVEGTVLDRRSGERGAPVPRDLYGPARPSTDPEAIYAGPLYFHFGHFLLESLARVWYAAEHPDLPLVWAGQHDWRGVRLRPWQLETLALLGLTNPVRLLSAPTAFDRLHVPDIGYRYDDTFHPDHAAFLGRYEGPAQVAGRRLWLSRARIESDVRDLNAEATERRLAAAGWTITHPQRRSVRQQLDQLSQAEVVAGEEGSAFHTLVLLSDVTSKKFEILRRQGPEHANMHTVGDARHVDQSFHTLQREVIVSSEGRVVSKVSPSSAEVLDLLGVPVPPPTATGDWTDEVVGRTLAALEPRRLLDVGAASARPVVTSTAPVRVLVSRRLDDDPRVLTPTGVDVYELDLDQYAEHFHGDAAPFDVVRITGRQLEDVMDAFRASQRLTDGETVWVLGCGVLAGRAALAVARLHPGFVVERLLVRRKVVFVVRRLTQEPTDVAGVAALSEDAVKRGTRWLRVGSLRRLSRRDRADRVDGSTGGSAGSAGGVGGVG